MEENSLKRYLILLLSFLLIAKVLSCSLISEDIKQRKPRCEPISETTEISSAEIDAFLKLWSEYVEKGYDKTVSEKISLLSGELEDKIPLKVKLWFNNKCWTIDRFFYVEDRIRASVRTLYLKRHSDSILSILNEKMTKENAEQYQQMIDMQNQIANVENISDEELKQIEMREAQIVKALNMK